MTAQDRRSRFEELFRTHRRAIYLYAYRRSRDRERAADVVGETFLVCWRRLDDVPERALPWLYGVARNCLLSGGRAARRADEAFRRAAAEPPSEPELGDAVAERDLVLGTLADLSERDREALLLVGWEGLEGTAAARAAGCSRTAFAMRFRRAKRRFEARLAELDPPIRPSQRPMESLDANS
jgi:RNA polymerase sigma factor (sigma-70 family)